MKKMIVQATLATCDKVATVEVGDWAKARLFAQDFVKHVSPNWSNKQQYQYISKRIGLLSDVAPKTILGKFVAAKNPSIVMASQLRQVLLPESIKRLRFRGEWECVLFDDQRVDVSYALGFYEMLLRRTNRALERDVRYACSLEGVAKEISDLAFRYRESFSKSWRYWCHVARVRDFLPEVKNSDFLETIKYWVEEVKEHTWDGSKSKFFDMFDLCLAEHDSSLRQSAAKQITYDEWLRDRGNWANSGSAYTGKRNDFSELGQPVDHTKYAYAWSYSDEQIMGEFLQEGPALHKAMQKRELSKVRAVIAADLKTYLRMKYLSDKFVGGWYKDWSYSPLFMKGQQLMDFWQRMGKFNGVRMPLDQSEFDQQALKECVMRVIKYWASKCSEDSEVWRMLIDSLERAQVVLEIEDGTVVKFKYNNGVLSGWYWTALMDTVLNDVTRRMAEKWVQELGVTPQINLFCCQGDDDVFEFEQYRHAVLMWLAYVSFGFIVNPSKFYISSTNDEFLRRVVLPGLVTGYPARSITSLLWGNPVGDDTLDDELLLSSRLSQWLLFANRMNCPLDWLPFKRDLIGVSHLSSRQIDMWLNTPKTMGGAGVKFNIYDRNWLSITPLAREYEQVRWTTAMSQQQNYMGYKLDKAAIQKTMKVKVKAGSKTTLALERMDLRHPDIRTIKKVATNYQATPTGGRCARTYPEPLTPTNYAWISRDDKPKLYDRWQYMYDKMSKRLQQLFDKGLRLAAPNYAGWSESYMASRVNSWLETLVTTLWSFKHRITLGDWLDLALAVEQYVKVPLPDTRIAE